MKRRTCIGIMMLVAGLLVIVYGNTQGTSGYPKKNRLVIGYFLSLTASRAEYPSARRASDVLTHLCPTRVAIADTEGNVRFGKDNYLIALAEREGITIWPLVTNGEFSKEIAHAVLSDPAKRTKVIDQLLEVCRKWKAPGVNIDLENIDADQRQNLNAFMQELCDRFHEKGLVVTIDVAAKTRDAPEASWAGVYDYAFLGKCCDLVMLMCYDEHWSGGSPGPIGSKPWVRRVLEYATSVIPREKVVLGVPFYGYDWPEKGRARSVNHKSVTKIIEEKKPTIRWDNVAKSHWFEYQDGDVKRTVYYETPLSMKHRIALAQEFGVAGISIWCLGNENPEFWKLLADYRKGRPVVP